MTAKRDEAGNMVTAPDSTAAAQPNWFARQWRNLVRFISEVRVELKKTNWPTRNELTKYVVVVVATIFAVAVYLFLLDQAGQFLSERMFNIHVK